jgi:hypothetical protein
MIQFQELFYLNVDQINLFLVFPMPKGLPFLKQFLYQGTIIEGEDDIYNLELSRILLRSLLQGLLDLINEELLELVHLALLDLANIE